MNSALKAFGCLAGVGCFGLLLLFLMVGGGARLEPPFILIFGWIGFLERTIPKLTWNGDLIGMGVLCSVFIVLVAQGSLDWLTRQIAAARNLTWRWRWKWTLSGLAAIGLCFLVGMSVGGVAHQVGWLSSQSENWFERKGEEFMEMRRLEAGFHQALMETSGDVDKLRSELKDSDSSYFRRWPGESALIERFHLLLITDSTNKVVGSIIFHRDPERRSRSQVRYSFEDKDDHFQMEKLPELLNKHQKQLLAL